MFLTVKKVASGLLAVIAMGFIMFPAAGQNGIIPPANSAQAEHPKIANSQKEKAMFTGLQTVMIHVDDMEKAKKWYTEVLGVGPYFDEPNFYIGFHVGGYELGLHPADAKVTKGGSTYVYWGTKDARAELSRLLKLGAKLHQDVQDVGGGILVATVTDPWGNIFGVIENPHFKLSEAVVGGQ